MNWTVEWERTGDTQWRDLVLADMKAMAAGSQGGRFAGGGYFDVIFGGPENMWEMEPMYPDVPDFWRAWADTCEYIGRKVNGGQMTAPRMLAYAAYKKQSPELGLLAWQKLIGNALPPPARPAKVQRAEPRAPRHRPGVSRRAGRLAIARRGQRPMGAQRH